MEGADGSKDVLVQNRPLLQRWVEIGNLGGGVVELVVEIIDSPLDQGHQLGCVVSGKRAGGDHGDLGGERADARVDALIFGDVHLEIPRCLWVVGDAVVEG